MPEGKTIEQLRAECEAAREAYHAASRAFGARVQAGETPKPEEWRAEELARSALVAVQLELRSALAAEARQIPEGSDRPHSSDRPSIDRP